MTTGEFVLVLLVGTILALAFLFSQREMLKRTWHLVWTNIRICLGLLQILSLLGDVIDTVYPRKPMSMMRWAAVLVVDIRGLLLLDCQPGWTYVAGGYAP